jgi:TolB-like protein
MRSINLIGTLALLAMAAGCSTYHPLFSNKVAEHSTVLPGTKDGYHPVMVNAGTCSRQTPAEANSALQPARGHSIYDPSAIQASRSAVGHFNTQIMYLADQLERNADKKSLSNTFIVTSFVNLNKLSETSELGRLVAENLIHELQVRKWQVYEVRLTKDISINETGEFSLSRDISKIRERYKIGGMVTGTYATAGGSIIINARSIDINTGIVASSAQARIPSDWFTDTLLLDRETLKEMKIVGEH